MTIPTDRVYSATHEWFLAQDRIVTMGITQYAADELTDITYVELPEVGSSVGPDAACGGVESVKAYSELYSAVTGRIVEVNKDLEDNPALVNDDAQNAGWLLKIDTTDLDALGGLMDAKAYGQHIAAAG